MLILGLDLALSCGWGLLNDGVVEGCGAFHIKAPGEGRVGEVRWRRQCLRLESFSSWLTDWRTDYGGRLSGVAYEAIAPSKKHGRDRVFNHYALAAMVTVELGDICPIGFEMPSSVKKAITGNGRAEKSEVRREVNRRFGLRLSADENDASDAVAVAWAHYKRRIATAV